MNHVRKIIKLMINRLLNKQCSLKMLPKKGVILNDNSSKFYETKFEKMNFK